jgi:hypothetical protein
MIEPLAVEALLEIYHTARSVFRVELLQFYDWPDEAHRVAEWQATGTVTSSSHPSWRQLAEEIAGGVRNTLLHVIDLPLSDYLRYEFEAYQADNLPAGQDVRIAVRNDHPELAELTDEFAVFDDAIVVWYRYNKETGVKLGWERDHDPDTLARCRRLRDLAMSRSTPLTQFIKELKGEVR